MRKNLETIFSAAAIFALAALSGCTASSGTDQASETDRRTSARIDAAVNAKDMASNAPIMIRIFKEEGVLEIWKQTRSGRFGLASSYDICKWSGKLGPKFVEGDRQAPEGFYSVNRGQMNPNSDYHLSFNIGYPNAFDRVNGRYGRYLMVHGGCSSAGCYSMTDQQIEDIYAFANSAFKGGQSSFQVQAFPFRMTEANMSRYKGDPNYAYWSNLKEGYDRFETTRTPPKVDVCEKRYVFDRPGESFSPAGACPPSGQQHALEASSYGAMIESHSSAFASVTSGLTPPAPSISGIEEAAIVADWSRRRARGETVSREPPDIDDVSDKAKAEAMARVRADGHRAAREAQASTRRRMQASASTTVVSAPRRF